MVHARRDQVEAAIASSSRRLTKTFGVIENGRDLHRRTVDRLPPTEDADERADDAEEGGEG